MSWSGPIRLSGRAVLALGGLASLFVAGCANPQITDPLPLQEVAPFSETGEAELASRWWTAFEDDRLAAEIEAGLNDNFTVAAAYQRVGAARYLAIREATDFLPDLNGVAGAGGTFLPGPDRPDFRLGLEASYQPDLWGQISWRVEAERLRATSTLEDYQNAALVLSAEIARVWFSLMEAQAQKALVAQQIETNERGLELLETRFGSGQIRGADVLRQRQLVESTREQAVNVQTRIELLEHQLAVLQGRASQEASYDVEATLPEPPPLPRTGLPAELLQRRPDVRREFLALLAADRDVAAAVSTQYPRLNLTASLTTAAESPENLFRDWIASIAGQLVAPLFDAGQRRAEVYRNTAIVRERLADYGQTVVIAYRQVEDALTREKYVRRRIEFLDSQIALGEQVVAQLREQYITGVSDYLAVLTAITEQQRLQREVLSARLELVLARVALYRALSGDFMGFPGEPAVEDSDPDQPASPELIETKGPDDDDQLPEPSQPQDTSIVEPLSEPDLSQGDESAQEMNAAEMNAAKMNAAKMTAAEGAESGASKGVSVARHQQQSGDEPPTSLPLLAEKIVPAAERHDGANGDKASESKTQPPAPPPIDDQSWFRHDNESGSGCGLSRRQCSAASFSPLRVSLL